MNIYNRAREWNVERARLKYEDQSNGNLYLRAIGAMGCMGASTCLTLGAFTAAVSDADRIVPNSIPGVVATLFEGATVVAGYAGIIGSADRAILAGGIALGEIQNSIPPSPE